jgi:KaiC/GvpD/RAD55 family RecA-like ATPase
MTNPVEDDRYLLDGTIPGVPLDSVPSGTNLLVVGDETTGAAEFVYRALARAPLYDEHTILVTTEQSVAALVEAYRSRLGEGDDLDHLRVVDASRSGLERDTGSFSPARIETASSPGDVTGIGVGITNHLRSIRSDRVRLGMLSLSAVVDRIGPEQAFALFHVLTSRGRTAGHLGLFVVDPTRHDSHHVRTLQSLTDGAFTFRTTDDGRRQVRSVGIADAVSEWTDVG